ncbi:MAG TPA: sulfite exporter TauE/SafE family protein [Solirubrobacterales bacterium]|nr:sulfite exporter TauE/SafE family protein [Solirubrobacterales bacterium]
MAPGEAERWCAGRAPPPLCRIAAPRSLWIQYDPAIDALELIALAVWSFTVSAVGGLVGLVLGNLRLPLVVLLASSPAAGAGANVGISGVAAITAAGAHARAGRVNWRLFGWMAPTSLVGAIVGGLISGALPSRVLLGVIAVVVLYGALEVLRYRRPVEQRELSRGELVLNAAAIGFGVGVIGGVVGLILGSLRLPAMVKWAGVGPYGAVGTNAAVGAVVGIGGVLGHLPSGVDWNLLAVGAAAAVPGAYLGSHLTGRLDERALLRACAAVMVVSGASMLAQAIVG